MVAQNGLARVNLYTVGLILSYADDIGIMNLFESAKLVALAFVLYAVFRAFSDCHLINRAFLMQNYLV